MKIEEKLDKLAVFYNQRDRVEMSKQEAINMILTDEIRQQLQDIEEEFALQTESVNKNIKVLENEIKDDVVMESKSVKGSFLQAVYSKPRVTWDTKALDGYAVANPDLLLFKKSNGVPSVSIRVMK